MVIARLVTELRCYLPERAEPGWTRLRHLGARRARFVVQAAAAHQQIRDLLECAWPAVLGAAAHPLDSRSWLAAVTVACDLAVAAGGQLGGPNSGNGGGNGGGNGWGWEAFAAAVRAELGPTRWHSPIVGAVFDAATDPAHTGVGVLEQRLGALERVRFTITDLAHLEHEIAVVEAA